MTAWKSAERRAARVLGGKRHVRLDLFEPGPDVDHPLLSIEVKYRRRLPALLEKAIAQAASYDNRKPPAVVLFERGRIDGLVVLRLSHFASLFGAFPWGTGSETVKEGAALAAELKRGGEE